MLVKLRFIPLALTAALIVAATAGEAFAQDAGDGDDGEGEGGDPAEGAPSEDQGDGGEAEAEPPAEPEMADTSGTPLRRSNRMDFDERLVKGQGARSGAVYLFKRTPRELPELVSLRSSYRDRIVEPVLGERAIKTSDEPEPTAAPSPTKVQPIPPTNAEASDPEEAEEAEEPTKAQLVRERRLRRRRRLLRQRRRRQRRQRRRRQQKQAP